MIIEAISAAAVRQIIKGGVHLLPSDNWIFIQLDNVANIRVPASYHELWDTVNRRAAAFISNATVTRGYVSAR